MKTENAVRIKIAALTADVRCQVDLDEVVARAGGLGTLYRTEFPGVAMDEFLYEWESRKLAFGGCMAREDGL